jgi:hypothetical protein
MIIFFIILVFIVGFIFFGLRLVSSLASGSRQLVKMHQEVGEPLKASKTEAAAAIDLRAFANQDEYALADFIAVAVEDYSKRAQLLLTDQSLIVFFTPEVAGGGNIRPPLPPPPGTKISLALEYYAEYYRHYSKYPLVDMVQFHVTHESFEEPSKPSPKQACARVLIGSRNSISGPVPDEERTVKWKKEHQAAIDFGQIGVEEIRRTNIGDKGFPADYNQVIGYHSYSLPEGYFFDLSGHCFCFYLYDSEIDCAEKFLARISALRGGSADPLSYEKVPTNPDQGQNPAPWLAENERLDKQWHCQSPPQGAISRWLVGAAGSMKIHLTNRRLIVQVTDDKKAEISDFPVDCVRGLTWNIGSKKGTLKVSTWGLKGLQMPTSSLVKNGYWGRELFEFDNSTPNTKAMADALNARFEKPATPPPIPPS